MGLRQVVRHWVLVPAFAGSNPADPARYNRLGPVSSLLYLMDSPEFEGLRFVIERSEIDFPADQPVKYSKHICLEYFISQNNCRLLTPVVPKNIPKNHLSYILLHSSLGVLCRRICHLFQPCLVEAAYFLP